MEPNLKELVEALCDKVLEIDKKIDAISKELDELKSDMPSDCGSDLDEIKNMLFQLLEA